MHILSHYILAVHCVLELQEPLSEYPLLLVCERSKYVTVNRTSLTQPPVPRARLQAIVKRCQQRGVGLTQVHMQYPCASALLAS